MAPDLDRVRELARGALAALEASRRRIDDLNVYPVPDGDTGTNMTLTVRATVDALEASTTTDRPTLMRELSRAALMGARGNSGVILSQIVRGFVESLGEAEQVDAAAVARAFRSASDAAYKAVRKPVEGTILTEIRELAEEAGQRIEVRVDELLAAVLRRGEDALARTREMLDVLREAGVVDAGAAGLLELVRGANAALTGQPLPAPPEHEELGLDAIHQELSQFRYCTVFVVEGEALDLEALESELERLGDSLLVVGDSSALKVHVHTDDPGAALSLGTQRGALAGVEIADMHRQTVQREERLLGVDPGTEFQAEVVAVVAGAGNRRLFESLGVSRIVEGGQSMNPSTADILAAIEATGAPEVIVLPNNSNVILSAEQAAGLAAKPVHLIPTRSMQAGLAAMVAFEGSRAGWENADAMREAVESIATAAVTTASREVELNGSRVDKGDYLGLIEGEPVTGGKSFDEVASDVVERLLREPRGILTLLTGEDEPQLDKLLRGVEERHPELELEVHGGGQPLYPLLISAE